RRRAHGARLRRARPPRRPDRGAGPAHRRVLSGTSPKVFLGPADERVGQFGRGGLPVRSLSIFFGVSLLSLCFASASRAGLFPVPFTDESICGSMDVAGSMAATTSYMSSLHCASRCRAASAQCHRFVVRVASCDTAFVIENAAFSVRSCNEQISD